MRYLPFSILILSTVITSFGVKLNIDYEWKRVDFLWESPQQKQEAINSGDYNVSAIFLYDVDKAPDGRIFLAAIRDNGVPASVMTVTNKMGEGGPLLRPYPDWSWYRNKNCEGITGAYRTYIKCNHLFIMDCGKIGNNQVCPSQLLIFDLSTDKLVKRVIIPPNVANNKNGTGLLTTLAVSATDCGNIKDTAIVFITDTSGNGLLVYNANSSKLCRIESDTMKPTNATFTLENRTFSLADGILDLTLVRKDIYYAALAGDKMYKIDSSKLIECSINDSEVNEIIELAGILSAQTAAIASKDCVIFFSNLPETSIMCADTCKKINSDNMILVAQDSQALQFPGGMKVIDTLHPKSLLILTNRYQRFATDTLNLNEINFRILSISMVEISKETNCFASCNYQEN